MVSLISWLALAPFVCLSLICAVVSESSYGRHGPYRHSYPTVWSAWSWWSDCSRSCGEGVTRRSRTCLLWAGSKYVNTALTYCSGDNMDYRLCRPQKCVPETDFREFQCSLNNRRYFILGKTYIWAPIQGGNPCELNCRAEGYRFHHNFGHVLDGTLCYQDRTSVCVNGKCKSVGCDDKIESGKTFDACRACGGDNTTCAQVRNSALPKDSNHSDFLGYYYITYMPKGSTNFEFRENSRNYLALLDSKGAFVLSGNRLIGSSHKIHALGTLIKYDKFGNGDREVIHGTGPTSEDAFVTVLYKGQNKSVSYNFWAKNGLHHEQGNFDLALEKKSQPIGKPEDNSPRDAESLNAHALSDNTVVIKDDKRNLIKVKKKKFTNVIEKDNSSRLTKKKKKKKRIKKPKRLPKPAFCKPCQKPKDRNKQFCTSEFVSHVRISDFYFTKNETRYEVVIRRTYRNTIPLMSREYVWIPYKCRCPKLKLGRDYIIMGRTDTFKGRQLRLIVDHSSYVRNFSEKLDKKLEYIRVKKKCRKRKWSVL